MSDQTLLHPSPKIFGTALLATIVGYIGWKVVDGLLFREKNSELKMFRWFSSSPPKLLQDPNEKYQAKLIEREEISHDTRRFRFELPSKNHVLGLPIGQHIHIHTTINDIPVIRAYTPVSSDDDKGFFECVIKVYFKNVHPKFPDGGKMTQYLEGLKIGDSITLRGPSGKLQYHGKGTLSIKADKNAEPKKRTVKRLSMVAGGTGIAPMLQIIRDILKKNDVDKTELALLFANQTERDILLRNELEELASKYPNQFKLWYTLDRSDEGWKYSTGFVNKDMIKEHLHEPNDDTMILMCGPPPMCQFVNSQLDELGYPQDNRFKY